MGVGQALAHAEELEFNGGQNEKERGNEGPNGQLFAALLSLNLNVLLNHLDCIH